MKAHALLDHFREIGTWVDWDFTTDQLLHGDPDAEVHGIATAWTVPNALIEQAAYRGLNVIVTHEPAFYDGYRGADSAERLTQEKRKLLDRLDLTLIRCHDTWDRMPGVGICDTWAEHLGFSVEPRAVESFYALCHTGGLTLRQTADHILERVRPLGQQALRVLGDDDREIERLAVGTGAITVLPFMEQLTPDAILATDDGMNTWDGGLWALDADMPVLIVNHVTAEKPGMRAMAGYLAERYPEVEVAYLDVPLPYRFV